MDTKSDYLEPLILKLEEYSKTRMELFRLKSLDKGANLTAGFSVIIIQCVAMLFFVLILSLAVSFYLSEFTGNLYNGFIIVAGFYLLVGLATFLFQIPLKRKILSSLLSKINITEE